VVVGSTVFRSDQGRKLLVAPRDAAEYITEFAQGRARRRRMEGRDDLWQDAIEATLSFVNEAS
jgi:hypothetical protein